MTYWEFVFLCLTFFYFTRKFTRNSSSFDSLFRTSVSYLQQTYDDDSLLPKYKIEKCTKILKFLKGMTELKRRFSNLVRSKKLLFIKIKGSEKVPYPKIRCSRLALVKNWSNLGQFPTPCPKNKSNYIPPRIFLHFSKIFLIFRDGC